MIGVADCAWFNVPGDAALELRKKALGSNIDNDRKFIIAGSLPPLAGECPTESFESRMTKRFDKKVFELMQVPRHFILQECLWPPYSVNTLH